LGFFSDRSELSICGTFPVLLHSLAESIQLLVTLPFGLENRKAEVDSALGVLPGEILISLDQLIEFRSSLERRAAIRDGD
jgi:hypothetical protein